MNSGVVVAVLFVAAVLIVLIAWIRGRRRIDRQLRTWAQLHEWDYTPSQHDLNKRWRVPVVAGGPVDLLLRKSFPEGEVLSFDSSHSSGSGPVTHRHIYGLDLGAPVPGVMILSREEFAHRAPRSNPVRFDDPEFTARWGVLVQNAADVAAAQRLITPGFRRRLLRGDALLDDFTDVAFDDHYLLLRLAGDRRLEEVRPAADLLRELSHELRRSRRITARMP